MFTCSRLLWHFVWPLWSEHLELSMSSGVFAGLTITPAPFAERKLYNDLFAVFAALFLASSYYNKTTFSLVTFVSFSPLFVVVVFKCHWLHLWWELLDTLPKLPCVGISMAQVGEFSLSCWPVTSNLGLVQAEALLLFRNCIIHDYFHHLFRCAHFF